MNYEETFNKSGIKSNKQLPSQIKRKETNVLIIKFMIALFLTNSLTYILLDQPIPTLMPTVKSTFEIPKGFITLSIPIKLMVPIPVSSTEISILTKNNHVICKKAYLLPTRNHEQNLYSETILPKYRILIHNKDLYKVINQKQSSLWAFPSNHIATTQKRGSYEIIF